VIKIYGIVENDLALENVGKISLFCDPLGYIFWTFLFTQQLNSWVNILSNS